jgi:hypothetical protein
MKVGDRVRWESSNRIKEGEIVAIVPAGEIPKELKNPGFGRESESYLVLGRIIGKKGSAFYWPRASLLKAADGLSAAEIALCHANAEAVRAFLETIVKA